MRRVTLTALGLPAPRCVSFVAAASILSAPPPPLPPLRRSDVRGTATWRRVGEGRPAMSGGAGAAARSGSNERRSTRLNA
jgi:hypothetical protein